MKEEGWDAGSITINAGDIRVNATENFEPSDLNPLPDKRDPLLLLLEDSSLPLPRDQAKISLELNASQADACLPQGLSPSPPLLLLIDQ